jgi:hypothetical protein
MLNGLEMVRIFNYDVSGVGAPEAARRTPRERWDH